jgi:glycosyltransferase involved in cell wall biosynthesis
MRDLIARARRAGIRRIIRYVFSVLRITVCVTGRRIRYNYYLKNWAECRKNKKLLNDARNSMKKDSGNNNPLISVRIPTYNRGSILAERTIPSVLRQTYQNFEIIVVGDHCTDNTEELLRKFNDRRINFYNLPKRGNYPTDPMDRWRVAGVEPANKGVELCSGEWIAPLDDDDEFSKDHLEVLLKYALEHDYEMVYGVVQMEMEPGKWTNLGAYPPKCGGICHLSVLYHSRLKFFKYDINAWKYGEPADWNMWRRMKEAGVRIGFVEKVIGKHYLKGTQRGV